jgi:hypothetical protein
MVRIRFLTRTVYDTNGPGLGPVYAAGEVAEVTLDVAERWLRRGKAEVVVDEPAPAPEPPAPPVEEAAAEEQPAEAPVAPEPPPQPRRRFGAR